MANVKVNYLSRDFESLKQDLITFAKTRHPDLLSYFNDSSPDIIFIDAIAYVGDILSYYTDLSFNESFLSTAQARQSLIRILSNLGYFETGTRPSRCQVTLSVRFDTAQLVLIDGVLQPDPELLPIIESGMRLQSNAGQSFEILEEVSFVDVLNRTVIPILDGNNIITGYTIEKTAVATAGTTKIQRFYVTPELAKPFLTVILDDSDITEVVGVVDVVGNQFISPSNSTFTDPDQAYFEVKYLTQDKLFAVTNPNPQNIQNVSSQIEPVVQQGEMVEIPKRFIVRRDVNNLVSLIFGNNSPNFSTFNDLIQSTIDPDTVSYNQILNNTELGEIPPANSTLFIKYRVGGGTATNASVGQINTVAAKNFFSSPSVNITGLQAVRSSLVVRNDIQAVGGAELPTNEELRHRAGKIYAAQGRIVTYEDLKAILHEMPAKFGIPYRISYEEIKPRISNLQQVENGVNTLLASLLAETTTTGRQLRAQEITTFLADLRLGIATIDQNTQVVTTLDAASLALLGQTPTLWIGEKARLHIISINEAEQLTTAYKDVNGVWVSPNQQLKENIKEFLKDKRVIGDWVDIVDGRIVNFQIDFTVQVDKKNKQQVLIDCMNKLRDYFTISNWQINQPIFVANVETTLQQINGVINVVDLKFINIFGTDPISGKVYAPEETGRYRNNTGPSLNITNNRFLMASPNNMIVNYPDCIFEIRFPTSDIVGRAL